MSKLVLINFVRVFFKELPILTNQYRKFLWHCLIWRHVCAVFFVRMKNNRNFQIFLVFWFIQNCNCKAIFNLN